MSDRSGPETDEGLLAWFERRAEESYDALYDARTPGDATARYSDAKEFFRSAIGVARGMGKQDTAAKLEARLEHVKAVFRSQFT